MIDDIKRQYCIPIYNSDTLNEIEDSQIQFVINDQLFLETLLMEIRGKTISYSSHRAKLRRTQESILISKIEILEQSLTEENKDLLITLKNELETIRQETMKGGFIRSRSDWIDNGEKPTKMFCNLEKRNFLSKNISCIQREDGTFIYEPENILKEANSFYKILYSEQPTTNPDLKNEFKNDELPKLTNLEADMLEGILSLQEVSLTLKHMKNDKSPGSDGFSANFFKVFWKKLGGFVVRSINYSYNIGSLSITQKQGIITCIPKEGKPKQF